MSGVQRVLLSYPTVIRLDSTQQDRRRSWIQIAKTGKFVSNRYGHFSITRDDLAQMLHNFTTVTPLAPTELPVDFDHLSMDPKKPGDGIAAGWIKKLELRDDGNTLFAEVEWTPDGANRIANAEYRFVSPSFVKDHTHKDGKKIGTALLAAAVTNHPFLEGMAALTLRNDALVGLEIADGAYVAREEIVLDLSAVGQRVMIAPGAAHSQDEVSGTYEITEVVGEGDDAFAVLTDANGVEHKWFRATELLPASATPAGPVGPNLVPPGGGPPGTGLPVPGMAPAGAGAPLTPGVPTVAGPVPLPPAPLPPPGTVTVTAVPEELPTIEVKEPVAGDVAAPEGVTEITEDVAAEDEEEMAMPANGAPPPAGNGEAVVEALTSVVGALQATPPESLQDPRVQALLQQIAAFVAVTPPVAAPIAASQGVSMSTKFMLRNDKGQEFPITTEQLVAAGIKVAEEGETIIGVSELNDLKGTVTNLSERVTSLTAQQDAQEKAARMFELTETLDRLSKGAYITKPHRDQLYETFKNATDLSVFRAVVQGFTQPILQLDTEHGSGGAAAGASAGREAQGRLMELGTRLAKDEGLALRDALRKASIQLAADAEAYQDEYRQ